MTTNYDIIVIGAGLVGSSFVLAMQQQGLSIAVLEKNIPSSIAQPQKDSRPLSLAYGSQIILETLGIWQALAEFASPIKQVHVSEQGCFGQTRITAEQQGVDALGYVVPSATLHQLLYQSMAALDNVNIICATNIKQLQTSAELTQITAETTHGEQQLTTKLLVVADGTQSHCRSLLNIATDQQDHLEQALTALLELEKPHQYIAYERFSKQGTLALLPLAQQNQYRLVWTMQKTLAEQLAQQDDQQLLPLIQACFGNRLGRFISLKRTGNYPLKTTLTKQQTGDGFVIIGNAAHTLYPIAAQGFNLGLRDVAALSETLVNALHNKKLIGAQSVLMDYQNWREPDQQKTIKLTRGINNLFDIRVPGFASLRADALLALDILTPLKQRFAQHTMGLYGRLPKLARGLTLWK